MIRFANRYDNNKIIELLKDFAIKSDSSLTNNPLAWSKTHCENILNTIHAGIGFILIDDKQTDILIAIKSECFWIKDLYQLQEVMLTGNNKFVVYKLIKEYIRIAKDMIDKGEINQAVMSSYNHVNLSKFRLKQLEVHWKV